MKMNKKKFWRGAFFSFIMGACVLPLCYSCKEDEPAIWPEGGGGGDDIEISAPSGVMATVKNKTIVVTWNMVSGAESYEVYVNREHWGISSFIKESTVTSTRFVDEPVYNCNYYYKIVAVGEDGSKSKESAIASCYYANGIPTGGGDGDKPGDGSGDDDEGDEGQGGGIVTVPDAPIGLSVENYGSVLLPNLRVSWYSVEGATKYKVYRSRSANGSYSLLGETAVTYLTDYSPIEGKNYYKVKACNSAGDSPYSSYVMYDNDVASSIEPCPVQYGNCTVSGYTMTLRWSVSSNSYCGEPETAYLRVRDPHTGSYFDLREMSGTATSVSFNYSGYIDDDGYVYAGIILENEAGTSGGIPKVYDHKNKRWMY